MNTAKNGVLGCWSAGVLRRIRPPITPPLQYSITPLLLAAMLAFSSPTLASNPGADDASDAVYGTNWASGQNGGYGFGPWTNLVETNAGWAGFYIAMTNWDTSLNNIGSGSNGTAWASYANGPGFNQAVAFREFTDGALASGQTFTVYFENGFISNGGSCGFCLRTGFVANTANDYNTGRRFEFGFIGGSNRYFIVDGTSGGNQFDTGVGWTSDGLRIVFTSRGADLYDLQVVRLQDSFTTNFTRALYGTGGLRSVSLYNRNTDHPGFAGDVYFNLISVGTEPPSPYALLPAVQDSGGRRLTNASLQVVDASVGGPFGLLTNAQAQVLKSGYPAQLYDFAGLQAYAEPPTVPEANTRQLGARWIYDDWTGYAVDGTPAWSIAGGPLASVSGGGLALASNVYQDTAAGARAAYGGYTGVVALTVLNTNWDDYYAYAHDTVDDAWQVEHWGEDNPDALGDEDPDVDGQSNRMEWITGTVPTNDESFFSMWIERVSGVKTQVDVKFDPSFPSRVYVVRYRDVMTTNIWSDLTGYAETTSGTQRTVRDLSITNQQIYYRVQVGLTGPVGD